MLRADDRYHLAATPRAEFGVLGDARTACLAVDHFVSIPVADMSRTGIPNHAGAPGQALADSQLIISGVDVAARVCHAGSGTLLRTTSGFVLALQAIVSCSAFYVLGCVQFKRAPLAAFSR